MDEVDFEILESELARSVKDFHIFRLHFFDGYSADEIAKMVGVSERTARGRLKRVRDKLRTVLVRALGLSEAVGARR